MTRGFYKALWLQWAGLPGRLAAIMRRVPFTLTFFMIILVAGIVTQTVARDAWPSLMQEFGWNLPALKSGRLYALWAGLLFGSEPGRYQGILVILLLGVGALEYRRGTKWAILGFLVLGPISSIITMLLLWPFDVMGIGWVKTYLYPPDMGSSSASLLCWGLFVGGERGWWQKLFLWGTILVLILLALLLPAAWEADHMVAFLLGLLGSVLLDSHRHQILYSGRRERRGDGRGE